ncbi:MAG TPA: Ni/Fe hydrogenase subunit alpha [bacterium]|nr:Ni/Fe hydrogenase subunit alpha [bacterium]
MKGKTPPAKTSKSLPPAAKKNSKAARRDGSSTRVIQVDYLARVEGEGGLYIKISGNEVREVQFKIFEPPRFFEAFLRGRLYREAPDITARICGICPVAYQMSASHAIEKAFGVTIIGPIRDLRRLLYCGEWIESHALHVLMLHAPDFLGYQDAIQMAKDHPDLVQTGLKIKKIGNDIVNLLGGREIHPINVQVGGFYRVPPRKQFEPLIERLKWAREQAVGLAKWCATLPIPSFEYDYEFAALHHPTEYPFNEGRIRTSKGLDIPVEDFEKYFIEEHVPHSTSLQARLKERGAYFVGPTARYNLNYDQLSPLAQETAKAIGLSHFSRNPFESILVRAVEIVYACDEALRILEHFHPPDRPAIPLQPQAATGYGCTEAPRGMLYHRYTLDREGIILDARIVPPTSQNQKIIENDLLRFVSANLKMPKDELTWKCEQAIRNYDPCISCSCHFLKLRIERE